MKQTASFYLNAVNLFKIKIHISDPLIKRIFFYRDSPLLRRWVTVFHMDVIPADFYRSDKILSDGRRWLLRVSATEGGDQRQQQECGRPHRSASRVKRCCALRARKFIRRCAAERGSSSHTQWWRDAGGSLKEQEMEIELRKSQVENIYRKRLKCSGTRTTALGNHIKGSTISVTSVWMFTLSPSSDSLRTRHDQMH